MIKYMYICVYICSRSETPARTHLDGFSLVYICSKSETPARTHLDGFSLVFRLKVQMYVGPSSIRTLVA